MALPAAATVLLVLLLLALGLAFVRALASRGAAKPPGPIILVPGPFGPMPMKGVN